MPDNKRELTSDEESENSKRQKLDSNDDNPEDGINKLRNEILHKIGGFFDRKDRASFGSTNKKFQKISYDLDTKELNFLGFTGRKDNRPMTLTESRETYEHLKSIQEQILNFFDIFLTPSSDEVALNFYINVTTKMLDNIYLTGSLYRFNINWAKVFNNAIHVQIANYAKESSKIPSNSSYDIDTLIDDGLKGDSEDLFITNFFNAIQQGLEGFDIPLSYIIANSFKDTDCKDVLTLLIEKYRAVPELDYALKDVLGLVTKNKFSESIAYIENLIQQQKQLSDEEPFNVNNQP